jgi:hypothetical protein
LLTSLWRRLVLYGVTCSSTASRVDSWRICSTRSSMASALIGSLGHVEGKIIGAFAEVAETTPRTRKYLSGGTNGGSEFGPRSLTRRMSFSFGSSSLAGANTAEDGGAGSGGNTSAVFGFVSVPGSVPLSPGPLPGDPKCSSSHARIPPMVPPPSRDHNTVRFEASCPEMAASRPSSQPVNNAPPINAAILMPKRSHQASSANQCHNSTMVCLLVYACKPRRRIGYVCLLRNRRNTAYRANLLAWSVACRMASFLHIGERTAEASSPCSPESLLYSASSQHLLAIDFRPCNS